MSESFNGAQIEFAGSASDGADPGRILLCSYGSGPTKGVVIANYDPMKSEWRHTMTATNDNRVLIGNLKPTGEYFNCKLAVDGDIVCKRVVVQVNQWADDVFDPNYRLMPLNELQAYVLENRHLPGIPTTDEVLKNGASLDEMTTLLLRKVEELTQYVIQLQEEIETLKK